MKYMEDEKKSNANKKERKRRQKKVRSDFSIHTHYKMPKNVFTNVRLCSMNFSAVLRNINALIAYHQANHDQQTNINNQKHQKKEEKCMVRQRTNTTRNSKIF